MITSEKKLCIIGAGGFGREVLLHFTDYMVSVKQNLNNLKELVCFMVEDEFYHEDEIMGIPVKSISDFDTNLHSALVAIGEPKIRQRLVNNLPRETNFTTLIHPTSITTNRASLGEGSIVAAGVILTCNIGIGKHAHLNLHTTVGHDCQIGDYFTTAPGVRVSGSCTIGNSVYLGSNAAVRQGVTICDDVVVGMGGVVVKDITEPGIYIGNPCRKLSV